ncbi:tetratricopeptide repeat-containing sulfotransferase family protein [Luteimonas saliphila]|uniref:tetratricopeptide repeat-containing sulfotransferase family protein n=1 Tax=Luteimonas saliphila TaxID=2804919 RepID=UPI00192D4A39|nr:sulfotransferase [Luteimonas saliphila]
MEQALARGIALLRAGRFSDAVTFGKSLVATWPAQPRLFAFLADACQAAGDLEEAIDWIDKAIAIDPAVRHKVKKAWLLSGALRRDEIPALALQILAQADSEGGPGLVYWQVARLYYLHNRLREAIECYERALRLEDRPDWRYNLALARFYAGDAALAETDLEGLLAHSPQAGTAIYLRSVLRRQKPEDNHVADIRARLGTGFQKVENEAAALYALAKELEDLGEYGESFRTLESAATAKRGTIVYDVGKVTRGLGEICASMDEAAMAGPTQGHAEPGAIFIVGMPRTGTTLVQRLLMQSGRVADAGELLDFGFHLTAGVERIRREDPRLLPTQAALQADFAELGRRYMLGARQMADGAEMFIDKLPANFMYCGMIRKALPNARIIHLVRDPLDSCYAIFKTLFFSAYEFSYDQEELAEYYLAYRQMMQHWHEVMPGTILDVRYEELVTNPEEQSRRIYDWCGLDWSPNALAVPDRQAAFSTASAAQVREPVHARSVNSSRRHVERLKPLIDRLATGGVLAVHDYNVPDTGRTDVA